MLPRPPRAATFDCYGTLIDWEAGIRAVFSDLLRARGAAIDVAAFLARWEAIQFDMIQGPFRLYREILRDSVRATLEAFGLPYHPADGQRFAESMATWPPFPEVRDALERARTRVKLAIISNTERAILERSVALIGTRFDELVTAEEARAYKPARAPFRLALARLGLPPAAVVHVAFGFQYDIAPARDLNCMTVWVNRHGVARPPGPVPDAEIRDLSELPALLGV